jgi:uncharacterized protein (DUF488 family)
VEDQAGMRLYTIGFTKKSAEQFFGLLKANDVRCLVDIRLHPGGQLSGFAKGDDLPYFLRELAGCDYRHLAELGPTDDILRPYRQDHDWPKYARAFEDLMDARDIPTALDEGFFRAGACCLLCSEDTPEKCHRRLVAERLASIWADVEIVHLM